jgi:hypothetical protein
VETILDEIQPKSVLLDLSAGQLLTPHTLKERVLSETTVPDGVRWINGQEYADECGASSRQEYVEWLAHQADEPLVGGKSIKELFTYREEVALWWFTPMSTKHVVRHPFRWLFYMIAVLRRVRETYAADAWHVWTDQERDGAVLRSVLESEEQVLVHTPDADRPNGILQKLWTSFRESSAGRFLRSVRLLVRRSLTLVLDTWRLRRMYTASTHDQERLDEESFDILVQTTFPHSWSEVPDRHRFDPEVEQHDRYFGTAPWDLTALGFETAWMPTLNSRGQMREWKTTRDRQTLPDVAHALQISWSTVCSLIAEAWGWWATFFWNFEVRKVHRRWMYGNVDLGVYLYRELWRLVSGGGLRFAQQIEQYQAACEAVQPKAVLYRDEVYRAGRAVAAALKGRTQLVGVQHGLIGHEHTVYQIPASEVQPAAESPPDHVQYNPVPDVFACFGRETRLLFDEWDGYPSERVWVTGGLRHDHLREEYGGLSEREVAEIRTSLDLPQDKPVVLLCAGLQSELETWLRMTITAMQDLPTRLVLAVKLHPYHGGEDVVQRTCREMDFDAYSTYRERIYPLIAVSDVVVGGASTVILEAGLLNTPAVAFGSPGSYRHYNFERGELAAEVSNTEQLHCALTQRVDGEDRQEEIIPHMLNAGGDRAVEVLASKMHGL